LFCLLELFELKTRRWTEEAHLVSKRTLLAKLIGSCVETELLVCWVTTRCIAWAQHVLYEFDTVWNKREHTFTNSRKLDSPDTAGTSNRVFVLRSSNCEKWKREFTISVSFVWCVCVVFSLPECHICEARLMRSDDININPTISHCYTLWLSNKPETPHEQHHNTELRKPSISLHHHSKHTPSCCVMFQVKDSLLISSRCLSVTLPWPTPHWNVVRSNWYVVTHTAQKTVFSERGVIQRHPSQRTSLFSGDEENNTVKVYLFDNPNSTQLTPKRESWMIAN
jgi:hypothetical protein